MYQDIGDRNLHQSPRDALLKTPDSPRNEQNADKSSTPYYQDEATPNQERFVDSDEPRSHHFHHFPRSVSIASDGSFYPQMFFFEIF